MRKFKQNRLLVLNNPLAPRISPELAEEIGLNESILLLQVDYWLATEGERRTDGFVWIRKPVREIQETFGFWHTATIGRTLTSLIDADILVAEGLDGLPGKSSRWFRLNRLGLDRLKSVSLSQDATTDVANSSESVANCDNDIYKDRARSFSDLKDQDFSLGHTQPSPPAQTAESLPPEDRVSSSQRKHIARRRGGPRGVAVAKPGPLPFDWDLTAWHYAWCEKNTPALLAMMVTIAGQYKSTALANRWDTRYFVDPHGIDEKWIAYMWGALRIEQRRPGFTLEAPPEWRKTTIDGTKLMKDGRWIDDNRLTRYPQAA